MVETLHPDVYIDEVAGQPTISGASTTTAAFVGQSVKGPTDSAGLVTSYQDYVRQYGANYVLNMFLEDAVFGFFTNGGQRAFVGRITGPGALAALATLNALGGAPTSANLVSANSYPWFLAPGQTLVVAFDGGSNQTFTFNATRATKAGSAPTLPPAASSTLLIQANGSPTQTVTFAGSETTPILVAQAIDAQLEGAHAVVNGANIDLVSDILGTSSSVVVTGGTANAAVGQAAGSATGTGNVANIQSVQMSEALTILAGLTGGSASDDGDGDLQFTSATAGTSSSVQVKNSSTAVAFGFSNTVVNGSNAGGPVGEFTVSASSVGSWGSTVSVTTQRWGVNTMESLANGGTQVKLTDISKAQIGDIVTISDGTTTVIVHVRSIDLVNNRIQFQAVTLGASIASGATALCATSHKAITTLAIAGQTTDTIITVTSPSQFVVGSEITIDDGTHPVLVRVVTNVNGTQMTLNAALGVAVAQGTPIALQSFDLYVFVNGTQDNASPHTYLSMQPTNLTDYVDVRLSGTTNESLQIVMADLDAVVTNPLLRRPAPVNNVFLTGGNDGSTPGDDDYIGSAAVPKTGLYLFDELQTINMVAVPGITTQVVQGTLADYTTARKDIIALVDPPLADDSPLTVLDFLNNVLNRDTSYAALYYPWITIRDRYAPAGQTNPLKNTAPSGFMMGLYAANDINFNVSQAPANQPLLGVFGLTVNTSDGDHDLLNPVGVNVIRSFPGDGIVPMGARTLWRTEDGRQYVNIRRLLLFVETSLRAGLRSEIFKPIDPKTFRRVNRKVSQFLLGLWKQGMLFPSDNQKQAFFVKCDTENNPAETRNQGQLYLDVGVNAPPPAEFIVARIGLFDGTSAVDETIQNN